MRIPFVKMHGAGNDLVMIDDRATRIPTGSAAALARLAQRPQGIGCEGLILVRPSAVADFAMRFFNPDGSEADLCGNGARCVAAFARAIGAARADRMRFETRAGCIEAELLGAGRVRVAMPTPKGLRTDFVNSGVPHCIVPVDDLAAVDVAREGRRIRFDAAFAPEGTNVDFVTYRAPHDAAIRTYERGVEAESGACGTGAVATAVIGVDQYGLEFPVCVKTVGGDVLTVDGVRACGDFRNVTLEGPVARVFEGTIEWNAEP